MENDKLLNDLMKFIEAGGDVDNLLTRVKEDIEEKKNIITILFSKSIKPPYDGWKLESDNGNVPVGEVSFELVSFLKKDETSISSDEMLKRAKEMGADYNQKTAELFLANWDKIPESYREFYIIFSGTMWQDSSGDRHVPSLRWRGERWRLLFPWLDHGLHAHGRFLHLCK